MEMTIWPVTGRTYMPGGSPLPEWTSRSVARLMLGLRRQPWRAAARDPGQTFTPLNSSHSLGPSSGRTGRRQPCRTRLVGRQVSRSALNLNASFSLERVPTKDDRISIVTQVTPAFSDRIIARRFGDQKGKNAHALR
jgi:hypothetical protein